MGQYKDAWNQLKSRGKIVLASPSQFHARIIKALVKEKNKDLGYKLQLSEDNRKAVFTSKSEGNTLKFYLRVETNTVDVNGL